MSTHSTTAAWYRGGFSHVYTGGVGYDGAPCVARFAFTTDEHGAASLHFRTQRMSPDPNDNHDQPGTLTKFRWTVTAEPTGYETACGGAGWACEAVSGSHLGGSHSISLLPGTTYYLWVFPQTAAYCLWWIGSATVTTEGDYGSPSTVEVSDGWFGRPLVMSLSRRLADAVHTVTVDCAGRRTVLLDRSAQYPSVSWEPSLADYAPLLPNTDRAQATVTVESFCRGERLGSVSKTVTMRIPAGALAPTLSAGWVTLTPRNERAPAGGRGDGLRSGLGGGRGGDRPLPYAAAAGLRRPDALGDGQPGPAHEPERGGTGAGLRAAQPVEGDGVPLRQP